MEGIRDLFDWQRAAAPPGQPGGASAPVANHDLALALQLLSCNSRDRRQFARTPDVGARAG